MIAPSLLQVMPSHSQQSVSLCHNAVRPLSRESPARNWRREPFSCSVQEQEGETKESSISGTRTSAKAMAPSCCFFGECSIRFVVFSRGIAAICKHQLSDGKCQVHRSDK
ncbi:hypothetical protein BS78_K144800 [Paspalum vaginatum]|uniref:Uncharacterized protein n=1 Tax=Paspalum vaginatum TaxID=158149 RepID=A0A9W7X6A6_9POAL|nr:hypothetical protein BS78_K144800 [Paspalum vaginatum]